MKREERILGCPTASGRSVRGRSALDSPPITFLREPDVQRDVGREVRNSGWQVTSTESVANPRVTSLMLFGKI